MSNIIVTGLVRFGTSWIGEMLSLETGRIQYFEPYHPGHRKIFGEYYSKYYFLYQKNKNDKLNQYTDNLINRKYSFFDEFFSIRNIKDTGRFFIKTLPHYLNATRQEGKILIKDPYAFFLLEYLSKNFNFKNVVIIRQPGAFVYSFLRNYSWDRHKICNSLVEQYDLLERWNLLEFYEELKEYSQYEIEVKEKLLIKIENEDIRLRRASLIWKIFANVYLKMQKEYGDQWIFIKYEDFALNPIKEFKKLYAILGLNFTSAIENEIYKHSYGEKVSTEKFVDLTRNSKELVESWKKKLTLDQINIIKNITSDEYNKIYGKLQ